MDEGRWHLCAWHCQHTCKGAGCLGGCLGALVGGLAGLCLPEACVVGGPVLEQILQNAADFCMLVGVCM